jgi:hypothetical protein
MAMNLRLIFERPGFSTSKVYVDIPINFEENPQIVGLLKSGYWFAESKVIKN